MSGHLRFPLIGRLASPKCLLTFRGIGLSNWLLHAMLGGAWRAGGRPEEIRPIRDAGLLKALVRDRGGERLVQQQDLLDRQDVAHEDPARRHAREPDDAEAVVRSSLLGAVLHRSERVRAP